MNMLTETPKQTGTLGLIGKHPGLLLPLVIAAAVEAFWLTLIFYFPRPPVSALLGPPVRVFFGAQFLHYPFNFMVLPRLMIIGRTLVYLGLGTLLFNMLIGAVQQVKANEAIRWIGNFNRGIRRFGGTFFRLVIGGLLFYASYKLLRVVGGRLIPDQTAASFTILIVFTAVAALWEILIVSWCVFSLSGGMGFLASLKRAATVFKKGPLLLAAVFGLRLVNAVMTVLRLTAPAFILNKYPLSAELVLVVIAADIAFLCLTNSVSLIMIIKRSLDEL